MTSSMGKKTLVADLPMMWPSDYYRFEKEGGVWGRQLEVRRKQLTFGSACGLINTVGGTAFVYLRKNTAFTIFSTFPGFFIFGFCVGMAVSPLLFENVANNQETSMMRRVWWAKECAKCWDYSQVKKDRWKALYPHEKVPH